MANVNKVIIIGKLGRDPEIKHLSGGSAVCNLAVATTEKWKDKSGELQERTEWHRLTLYGRQAEIAGEYLQKGSECYFEGKLQTRKWQDKSGQDRYTTEINVREMQFIGGKQSGGQRQQEPAKAPQKQPQTTSSEYDDDIPF